MHSSTLNPPTPPKIDLRKVGIRMPRSRYQRPKVFRAGRRPELWHARWYVYDSEDKRHSRAGTFGPTAATSRAEAQAAADKRVQDETTQTPPPRTELDLVALVRNVYLPLHPNWSPNTRRNLTYTINRHILPALGGIPLKTLNKPMLAKHLIAMAQAGCGRELVSRVRMILHAALEEAVDGDYLPKNPARRLEIPPCKPEPKGRSLTESEARLIFERLTGRDRLWFRVLILCGARPGEVMALRRDDVLEGALRIDESSLAGHPGPTKNRKTRVVPIPVSLRAELGSWLETHGSDLVFPNHRGQMMRRGGYPTFCLARARALTGIADLDFRMCRRSFATLIEGDVKDTQAMLGHSTAAMTLSHYKRAIPERQRASVEALERRLTGKAGDVIEIRRAG